MKIFIDTANLAQIKKAVSLGYVAGVTTNPTLIAQETGELRDIIADICQTTPGPVSIEVIGTRVADMVTEARKFRKIAPNVVVKVPMTEQGLQAVALLTKENIRTNMTLVFSVSQALLAAQAGATYVSPFVGRLDDVGQDGMQIVRDIITIYKLHGIKCEVIAASIRHPQHVVQSALAGAHIATIPFAVLEKMLYHPLTDIGLQQFLDDWRNK